MGDIGGRLRQAREQAGLSLAQVSARTKIQQPILDAIEREDFGQLPRGFFRRGFLRAYARELRLDAESIVREYVAEFERDTTLSAPVLPTDAASAKRPADEGWGRRLTVMILLFTAAALFFYFKDRADLSPAPVVAESTSTTTTGDAAVPDRHDPRQSARQEMTIPPETHPLTLEIVPTRVVWVEAVADGSRALYQLVQRGERRTLHAREELVIRVGDAAAFQYWLNGGRGRALGGSNEVRDIRITRDNYATFLAP